MKLFHFFILLALVAVRLVIEAFIMKCPVPGAVEKIQIVKIRMTSTFGKAVESSSRYFLIVWVSEFDAEMKRTAIWDFAFYTYTVQYRPTDGQIDPYPS